MCIGYQYRLQLTLPSVPCINGLKDSALLVLLQIACWLFRVYSKTLNLVITCFTNFYMSTDWPGDGPSSIIIGWGGISCMTWYFLTACAGGHAHNVTTMSRFSGSDIRRHAILAPPPLSWKNLLPSLIVPIYLLVTTQVMATYRNCNLPSDSIADDGTVLMLLLFKELQKKT